MRLLSINEKKSGLGNYVCVVQKYNNQEIWKNVAYENTFFSQLGFIKNLSMESLIKSIDDNLTVLKFQITYLTHFSAKK